MPYASDKQRRFMHAKHPGIAAKWDAELKHGSNDDVHPSDPPGASHYGCCGSNARQAGCNSNQPEIAAGTRSAMQDVRQASR